MFFLLILLSHYKPYDQQLSGVSSVLSLWCLPSCGFILALWVVGKVAQGGGTISLEMCFWLSLLRRGKQKF